MHNELSIAPESIITQTETEKQLVIDSQNNIALINSRLVEIKDLQVSLQTLNKQAETQLVEISTIAAGAITARSQIHDEQAVIAAKSAHIQSAQEHADKVRAELDRIQTATTQIATEAEGYKSRAQSANDTAAEILAAIRGHKVAVESDLTVIAAARDSSKASADVSKGLADRAAYIETRVANYESRLAELEKQAARQLETIVGLLPGATAAGLAHAFDERRKSFLKPSTRWQWLFVGSVVALVLLAATGLWSVYRNNVLLGWDDLARLWLARLPIAAALIWLALHASRESALAKRLEEDYGYKAAIAASFLGFQKQMNDITASMQDGSPLSKLCEDTLATIGSSPGRIYDKHQLTVTPSGELAKAVSKAVSTPTGQ